ncbi:MAG TPA: hypothetical protein VIJ14_07735, partial [Rhabdochlamydiaceae bacterium]
LPIVPAILQNQFANTANFVATGLTSGYRVDAWGSAFDIDPTGGATACFPIHVKVSPCVKIDSKGNITIDVDITITFN